MVYFNLPCYSGELLVKGENMPTFNFKGCRHLQYDGFSVPRQAISAGKETAICFARHDLDGNLQLVQFCPRGRLNDPMSGITIKCCADFDEIKHSVSVGEKELESSPATFNQ
jgi:hypothetical protein